MAVCRAFLLPVARLESAALADMVVTVMRACIVRCSTMQEGVLTVAGIVVTVMHSCTVRYSTIQEGFSLVRCTWHLSLYIYI